MIASRSIKLLALALLLTLLTLALSAAWWTLPGMTDLASGTDRPGHAPLVKTSTSPDPVASVTPASAVPAA